MNIFPKRFPKWFRQFNFQTFKSTLGGDLKAKSFDLWSYIYSHLYPFIAKWDGKSKNFEATLNKDLKKFKRVQGLTSLYGILLVLTLLHQRFETTMSAFSYLMSMIVLITFICYVYWSAILAEHSREFQRLTINEDPLFMDV
jgi:hypothetical protein